MYGDRSVRETMAKMNDGFSKMWKNAMGNSGAAAGGATALVKQSFHELGESFKNFFGQPNGSGSGNKGKNQDEGAGFFETLQQQWHDLQQQQQEKYQERQEKYQEMKDKMPKADWSEFIGMFTNPEETIEAMKDRNKLREKFDTMKEFGPELVESMITERDEIMSNNLKKCKGKVIVAVVGIGHMDGMEDRFRNV